MDNKTPLDQAIAHAYAKNGEKSAANQVWVEFLRSKLYLPIDPTIPPQNGEDFQPLFALIETRCFLAVFDTKERFKNWSHGLADEIKSVIISGHELIKGIDTKIYLALNIGTPFHKEFSPDEIQQLKKIAQRLDQLKNS